MLFNDVRKGDSLKRKLSCRLFSVIMIVFMITEGFLQPGYAAAQDDPVLSEQTGETEGLSETRGGVE